MSVDPDAVSNMLHQVPDLPAVRISRRQAAEALAAISLQPEPAIFLNQITLDEIRRWGTDDTEHVMRQLAEGDAIRAARRGLWLGVCGPPRILGYWQRMSPIRAGDAITIWLRNEVPATQLTVHNLRLFRWMPDDRYAHCHGLVIYMGGIHHLGTLREGVSPEPPLGWTGRL